MKKSHLILIFMAAALILGAMVASGLVSGQDKAPQDSRLAIVWSSGDPDVAHRVCFMYAANARKQNWFNEVSLIVWGPSARLLAADKDLQAKVKAMMNDGVKVQACLACSDSYGITEQLRALGIEVKYMGKPLTDMLKSGWKVLTL